MSTTGEQVAKALEDLASDKVDAFDAQSAALLIATRGDDEEGLMSDALASAYARYRSDSFRASGLIEALGVLTTRSSRARAKFKSVILALLPDAAGDPDERHTFISACRGVALSDRLAADADLREVLAKWAGGADIFVQAEARYQLAVLQFSDALKANDRESLVARLGAARAAFANAEASEECRPDAYCFKAALDVLLAFARGAATEVAAAAAESHRAASAWLGVDLASDRSRLISLRLWRATTALDRMLKATASAATWLRFDEALLELATLVAAWQAATLPSEPHIALSLLGPRLVAPTLGLELCKSVTALRMAAVVANAEAEGVPDEIMLALRALQTAMLEGKDMETASRVVFESARLGVLAERRRVGPSTFMDELLTAIEQGDHRYLERQLPRLATSPLDHPASYSANPNVDEVVRKLLRDVHAVHATYPPDKWGWVVEVLVELLTLVETIRDTLPSFVLCEADGGKGPLASELDLQNELMPGLRRRFGNTASYELTRLGGGRCDLGIVSSVCRLPIEVKHEFSDVSKAHVHAAFATQPGLYASATDGISFLVVLDLRAQNAAAHRKGRDPSAPALYSLDEGAWVQPIAADVGVDQAAPKAVVVLLVPGNRPRPSSTTKYSARPRAGRRTRRP